MAWRIELTPQAAKQLAKIGSHHSRRITSLLRSIASDPRSKGGPLKGRLREFWRYRVGDYRVLVKLEDDRLVVLVVEVIHRSKAYRKR